MNIIARSKLIIPKISSRTTNIICTTTAATTASSSLSFSSRKLVGSFVVRKRMMMSSQAIKFPIQQSIQTKLTNALNPIHLDVINESHMHNVPENSETHFKIVIVSDQFEDMKTIVQRHRTIYNILNDEMSPGKVHALSIVAKTPTQWSTTTIIPPSPSCRGGDGSLPSKKQAQK
mmetsp:Transcript_7654/g.10911  ORF Transcript_7654/g.10911 Transcript_7654/m.10911 type:complete len:175 (+) Transcript_7654:45-569(+)